MTPRIVRAALLVCCSLALAALIALAARTSAYAEPEPSTLPPIFRVGTSVRGVSAAGGETLTILETRGKWVRAQTEDGKVIWFAPEAWTRWLDPSSPADSASTQALAQMAAFGAAVERFRLSNRSLPATLEDLTRQDQVTRETYLESGKVPLDPWGAAYEYRVVDEKRIRYVIRSTGPDRLKDTDDDVYYPERPPR